MKALLRTSVLIVTLVWGSSAAQAQGYTLRQCIETALKNNAQLRNTELNLVRNQNNLTQSYANSLPSVSANGSQSYTAGGRSVNPFDNSVLQDQTFRTNNFSLAANWNVFNGGANTYAIQQNKHTVAASRFDLQQAENDLSLNVANAFLAVLSQKEQLASSKAQTEATKAQIDRTQRLVTAGSLPQANLLTLQSQLATEELQIVNDEATLEQNKLQLAQLMQIPFTPDFDIQNPVVDALTQPILENSPQAIYESAAGTLPQIKGAQERVIAAQKGISSAFGSYLPSLSVQAGYFTNYSSVATRAQVTGVRVVETGVPVGYVDDPTSGQRIFVNGLDYSPIIRQTKFEFFDQLENNLRRSLSFNLNIPIFSNLQSRTAVANAKISKRQAEQQEVIAKNTLRQDVERAFQQARAAGKRYEATNNQIKALEETLRATEERFKLGAANSVEYNTAKTNLARAQTDLIRAKYDYVFRKKVLDFYQGKALDL